jgi:hypothetical protein
MKKMLFQVALFAVLIISLRQSVYAGSAIALGPDNQLVTLESTLKQMSDYLMLAIKVDRVRGLQLMHPL